MKRTACLAGLIAIGVVSFGALPGCGDDAGAASGLCEAFCGTLDMCGLGLMSGPCMQTCENSSQQAAAISGACASASAAEGRCVAALSCDGLDAWREDGPDAPCQAEDAAAAAACNP